MRLYTILLRCVTVIRNGRSIHRVIIYTLCTYWHIILYSRITFLSIHTPYKSVILMVSIICEIVKLWIKLFTNPNSFSYCQFARIFYYLLFYLIFFCSLFSDSRDRKDSKRRDSRSRSRSRSDSRSRSRSAGRDDKGRDRPRYVFLSMFTVSIIVFIFYADVGIFSSTICFSSSFFSVLSTLSALLAFFIWLNWRALCWPFLVFLSCFYFSVGKRTGLTVDLDQIPDRGTRFSSLTAFYLI